MPASPTPRPASERESTGVRVDDSFTVSFESAARLLQCTSDQVRRLVKYTQSNAEQGIDGPLRLTENAQSLTLSSVFAYRRRIIRPAASL